MKRSVNTAIIILCFTILFCACGNKPETGKSLSAGADWAVSTSEGSGPQETTQGSGTQQENAGTVQDIHTSLGGIRLGDTSEKVTEKLGKPESDNAFDDESGLIGEGYHLWEYSRGMEALIGSDSGKLLGITVTSSEFSTNLGVKVGDTAADALKKYRAKYQEFQGANSDGKLTGWFAVEDGMLVILDFNKSDGTRINESVSSDSKVESIELAYAGQFD